MTCTKVVNKSHQIPQSKKNQNKNAVVRPSKTSYSKHCPQQYHILIKFFMFEISSSLTFGYKNVCIISFLNPKLHPFTY